MQMMKTKKLNRVRLINWMFFSDETINFDKGTCLISGENATGKSTALDAIQMVLTANTTKFNKAANENSDRDLKSYVRCKIDTSEKTFLRQGTVISNVALEFYEEKEKRFFVIGVHITSNDESETPAKKWYIENGRLEEFNFTTSEYKPALADEFRIKNEKVRYITKLHEYKVQLRHRLGNLEDRFFEVLLKALAFRPVDNVKDFINHYVLAEKTVDVQALRESIETLNEFESTLKKAKEERDALEHIIERLSEIEKAKVDYEVTNALIKIAEQKDLECTIDKTKTDIKTHTFLYEKKISEEKVIAIRLEEITNTLLELQLRYKGSDFARASETLEQNIRELKKEQSLQDEHVAQLERQINGVKKTLTAFSPIVTVSTITNDIVNMLLSTADTDKKIMIVAELERFLSQQIEYIREQIFELKKNITMCTQEISAVEKEIKQLEMKQIVFPRETIHLKTIIQEAFTQHAIDSRVYILSELLKITNSEYTNAIEGYLNTQRFYLVIDPEYYQYALEIYAAHKKSHSQGIINVKKLPVIEPEEHSLAQVLVSENRYAQRYVNYILGKVICVDSLEELEHFSTAITKDCMLYKNYVARKINPAIYEKPYIGEDAVKKQLLLAQTRFETKKLELAKLKKSYELFSTIETASKSVNIEIIKQNLCAPNECERILLQMEKAKTELAMIKKNPELIELQRQIENTEADKKKIESEKEKNIELRINLQKEIEKAQQFIIASEALLQEKTAELEALQEKSFLVFTEAHGKYLTNAKTKSCAEIIKNFLPVLAACKNKISRLIQGDEKSPARALTYMQSTYNARFYKDFPIGEQNSEQYYRQFEKLDTVDIVRREEEIRLAREKCEVIFKNEFLWKLHEAIESAKLEFYNVGAALKDIHYGDDTYKFIIHANKQKENLYRMIMSRDNLGGENLFTGGFQHKYKEEIDDLFLKIQSDDTGDTVVKEYTDYRTYLDYDIEITKANGTVQKLSSKAKSSSGGESQVPFYIIMAASLHTIYKENSIRLLLLDEAFNNMDEQRISSVMTFFKALNFQTILVSPSPKIQDIHEHVDKTVLVLKEGYSSFVWDSAYEE